MYQQHHTRVDPRDPPRRKRTKGHVRHLTPTRRSMRNSHAMILTAAPSSRQHHEACRASFHWQGTKPRTAAFGWKDHDPQELEERSKEGLVETRTASRDAWKCAQSLASLVTVEPERLTFRIPKHAAPVRGLLYSRATLPRTRQTSIRGRAPLGG